MIETIYFELNWIYVHLMSKGFIDYWGDGATIASLSNTSNELALWSMVAFILLIVAFVFAGFEIMGSTGAHCE